jgi:hypothetical protein
LIIPLNIQTIRQVPSGSAGIDGVPNVSRADPSGADQIDAEHTKRRIWRLGFESLAARRTPQVSGLALLALLAS